MNIQEVIKSAVESTLKEKGLNQQVESLSRTEEKQSTLSESYVVEAGKFNLQTELLSSKTKKAHQELLESYNNPTPKKQTKKSKKKKEVEEKKNDKREEEPNLDD